jgi:hypothetical protein
MYVWNYYASLNYLLTQSEPVDNGYGEKGSTRVKTFSGSLTNKSIYPLIKFSVPTNSTSTFFLWVGTGTEEPNLLDYDIPNKCNYSETDGLSVASVSNDNVVYDETTNSYQRTSRTVLRNNGTEDITVTEVYLLNANARIQTNSTLYYKALLPKEITIGAGKYLELTLVRSFDDKTPTVSATISE